MTLEILVSTMMQTDFSLLEKMNIQTRAVVVNQCKKEKKQVIEFNRNCILWIDTKERGLSKSRNMALRHATADICVLADDDEVFVDGYADVIKRAFIKRRSASVLRFQVAGIEGIFKKYPNNSCKLGYIGALRMSSVEIAFQRESVIAHEIWFDELLGAGSRFSMGEENAFIYRCLDEGLKIIYEPEMIARLHLGDSTWFRGFDKEYFVSKGAAFTAMNRKWSVLMMFLFIIRHISLCNEKVGIFAAFNYMRDGRKKYLKIKSDVE